MKKLAQQNTAALRLIVSSYSQQNTNYVWLLSNYERGYLA